MGQLRNGVTDCLVAVDVGNSAIKMRALTASPDGSERAEGTSFHDHSIRIDQPDWQSAVLDWVRQRIGCHSAEYRIASVHRAAAEQLERAIADSDRRASIDRVTHHRVPMRARVDFPDRLGIDRLVGAYAARRMYSSPLVVVDAGSAVTIDWVDPAGDFCGGAILPGVRLQLRSLASGTDALPEIDRLADAAPRLPGKNTSDAMRLGVTTGISATIDRMFEEYRSSLGGEAGSIDLVLTGGDSQLISPLLTHSHHLVENLVCRGLLDLPRSMAG